MDDLICRPKVYVAGPYTLGDVAINVRLALLAGDDLVRLGAAPFIPHLTHFWHLVSPHDYEFWLAYDREWLRVCDAVLRLGGASAGAEREEREAQVWNIPVFHAASRYDIPAVMGAWLRERLE